MNCLIERSLTNYCCIDELYYLLVQGVKVTTGKLKTGTSRYVHVLKALFNFFAKRNYRYAEIIIFFKQVLVKIAFVSIYEYILAIGLKIDYELVG